MTTETMNPALQRYLLSILACAILVAQFASGLGYIARIADHSAIVGIENDDARNAIEVTLRSDWWRMNDFTPYGPVYFRVANSLRRLVPWGGEQPAGSSEAQETAAHFSLLMVSWLSIFGLAATLAVVLCSELWATLTLTALLVAAFAHDGVWAKMVLLAHPDLLFAWAVVVALLVTLESLRVGDERTMRIAGTVWGVVASVKLTIVLFVPPLLAVWGRNYRKTARFLLWIAIGYFVIGFPQNFQILRALHFLSTQSQLSVRPELTDIFGWIRLFAFQLFVPLITLIAAALVLPRRDGATFSYSWRELRFALPIVVIPTIWMISRKVLSPFDYYPIPFVALILVLVTLELRRRRSFANTSWATWMAIALLVSCRLTIGFTPPAFAEIAAASQKCRPEARVVYSKISATILAGKSIYIDPYVPGPNDKKVGVTRAWNMNWTDFLKVDPQTAVFRTGFYSRYMDDEPSPYVKIENPNWQASRDFYRTFAGHEQIVDPQGRTWRRTYHDDCQMEIWER